MQGAKGRTQGWAASAGLVMALGHAGCATSHELELDAGVITPPFRDAGTTPPPDAGVDGGVIASDAGAMRDQYVDLSGIAVDPAWDVDVPAWLDAGGCGEITVPYQSWGGQQPIVLVPGATLPRSHGGIICQVVVDVTASPLITSNAGGGWCSPDPDTERAHCELYWTSPLSERDYLWLCRIRSLPPVQDIWCWEWGE